MSQERIYFDDQGGKQMQVVKEDVSPCVLASNLEKGHSLICVEKKPKVMAFAQNTREEVRILGDDGNVAGCVSAESGSHQTTYVCIRKAKDVVPRGTNDKQLMRGRVLCNDSKMGSPQLYDEVSCTILATSYKEPPLIIR